MDNFFGLLSEIDSLLEDTQKDFKDVLRKEAKRNPNLKINERKTPFGEFFEATFNKTTNSEKKEDEKINNEYKTKVDLDTLTRKEVEKLFEHSFNGDFREKCFKKRDTLHITKVLVNGPCVIAFWNDGTKTVAKCSDGDSFSLEGGVAICIAKKLYGNKEFYDAIDMAEYTIPNHF